jgi:hypothetical protein
MNDRLDLGMWLLPAAVALALAASCAATDDVVAQGPRVEPALRCG